jgi:hypothetical protein
MSTPPTGEDPPRGSFPGGQPPHGPQPGFRYPPPGYGQPTPAYAPPAAGPGPQPYPGPFGPQGPPAWQPGPPPAPARDRTRKRLILALELVALAIAVGVATLVYVLSSTILDPAAVERAVAQQFEEREGVALDLECGDRMVVRPGADYECEGTTADGEEVEITITITDDDGAYTWAED